MIFTLFSIVKSQIYTGKVIDVATKKPVSGAFVKVKNSSYQAKTDILGNFAISTGIQNLDSSIDYEIYVMNHSLVWNSNKEIQVRFYNLFGQAIDTQKTLPSGSGSFDFSEFKSIFFMQLISDGKKRTIKLLAGRNSGLIRQTNSQIKSAILNATIDSIRISKEGYFEQQYAYITENQGYEIQKKSYSSLDYLDKLMYPESFRMLQSNPLAPIFGEVKSVKIIYSIGDDKIYYANSSKYFIHFDFAKNVLAYPYDQYTFNSEQYTNNPNRIYYLANLNYFTASGIYTLEFFPSDEINCDGIKKLYDKIVSSAFFGNKLKLYINTSKRQACTEVPKISSEELYEGQNYQPLNPQENYGYIKKVDFNDITRTYLGRHDIVVLNGIPMDISVVGGIITTDFQTPLSHINVLSHNRGTPNMALRDGWENSKINEFLGKLVYFKVSLDSFYIREASLTDAQAFWAKKEPQTPHVLSLDTVTSGILDISKINVNSVKTVGGKVSNMGELAKISVKNYGPLPIPEGVFGIPFSYYWQHLRKYGLHNYIDKMLKDTLFWKDASVRQQKLKILADSIKKSPLDTALIRLVKEKLAQTGFKAFRFRSSTNSEDIQGFNGAGLYDSYTGTLDNADKPIDKAIKKTWASLWNFQAFEEREYFKIDHKSVAMGILINRSFPAEAANGVVITKNLFNEYNSAITINVQIGEISIVKPDENYLPDQIIYYTFTDNTFEYISHSTVPGMENKTVMTDDELKVLKDYCMAIHYHYCKLNFDCHPMDIEFKVDVVDGKRKIYIKQARLY